MLRPTGVKSKTCLPPGIVLSHRNAVGLLWRKSKMVVTVHQMVVLMMQNQRSHLCHLRMTMRSRNTATDDFEAAIPMMQIA